MYVVIRYWNPEALSSSKRNVYDDLRAMETCHSEDDARVAAARYTIRDENVFPLIKEIFLAVEHIDFTGMTEEDIINVLLKSTSNIFADESPYSWVETVPGTLFNFSHISHEGIWNSYNLWKTCKAVMEGVATKDLHHDPDPYSDLDE